MKLFQKKPDPIPLREFLTEPVSEDCLDGWQALFDHVCSKKDIINIRDGLQALLDEDDSPQRPLQGEGRYYGGGGTIHGTDKLDIIINEFGSPVEVWFRCQTLPFDYSYAEPDRIYEMPDVGIIGIELTE